MNRLFVPLFLFCAIYHLAPHPARADFLTSAQKNLEMLGETVLTTNDMLQEVAGPSLDDNLAFAGTFTNSGWALHLTGTFAGDSIDLSYTGAYDSILEQISYTGTGSVGAETWDQNGLVDITVLNPTDTQFAGHDEAHPPAHHHHPHIEHRNLKVHEHPDGSDDDEYDLYIDDEFVGERTSISFKHDDGGGRGAGGYKTQTSSVNGIYDFGAGTFVGTVRIPEPSTIVLACVGGIPLIVFALRRRRRKMGR